MIRVMVSLVLALTAGGAPPAPAAEVAPGDAGIKVLGTFVDDATGRETAWEAVIARAGDGRLSGQLHFEKLRATLHAGTLTDDQLMLQFTAPSGLPGVITGRMDARRINGAYSVGTDHGTWRGILTRELRSD